MQNNRYGKFPFACEEILLDDGTVIENSTVMIVGDFVVIDSGEDVPPTMINARVVRMLKGVQEQRPQGTVKVYNAPLW